jgi:hypothetical protein
MHTDTISRVKDFVGQKGLLQVRDVRGLRVEAGFTVLFVEPPTELEDDLQRAIDKSRFTVRFDLGTLIDGNDGGVYGGSAFSKLTGLPTL